MWNRKTSKFNKKISQPTKNKLEDSSIQECNTCRFITKACRILSKEEEKLCMTNILSSKMVNQQKPKELSSKNL